MLRIFVSYSRADDLHRRRLEAFLTPLARDCTVDNWDDTRIKPGDDWESEIRAAIDRADVAILLISQGFLASDYVARVEIPAIVKAVGSRGLRVFSVIISASNFDRTPLSQFQTINLPEKPLAEIRKPLRDRVWKALADAIVDLPDPSVTPRGPLDPAPIRSNIPGFTTPFVGRVDLLSDLRMAMSRADRVALVGMPGVGKTRAASEYAREQAAGEDPPRVLWVDADSVEALASGFAGLAQALGLPERDLVDQSAILAAVKNWLDGHTGWLLIFNNADDLDLIQPHLPEAKGGRVLITTRDDRKQRHVDLGAESLLIEKLTEEESARLILGRSGSLESSDPLETADIEAALAIAREVGGLPLALEQARAYILNFEMGPAEYLEEYRKEGKKLRGLFPSRFLDKMTSELRDRLSVTATFLLAFEAVRRESPEAADLLRLCALFDPAPIPEEILAKGYTALGFRLGLPMLDSVRRAEVIGVARRYSLVRRDARSKTLIVHRLVQAVLRDLMEGQGPMEEGDPFAVMTSITEVLIFGSEPPFNLLIAWARRAAGAVYLACPKSTDFAQWTSWDRLLPHCLICVDHVEQMAMGHVAAAKLVDHVSGYLRARGQLARAEALLRRSLAIHMQTAGEDHEATVSTQANLGNLLRELGKLEEAETLLRRALDFFRRVEGLDSTEYTACLNNLGALFFARGKHAEAKVCFAESLEIAKRLHGPDGPGLCTLLSNLASIHHAIGENEEAEALLRRALGIAEVAYGPIHPAVAKLNGDLAVIIRASGRPDEALEYERRAISIQESIDPDSPDLAFIQHNISIRLVERGEYAEAERCCRSALRIIAINHGPETPQAIRIVLTLANICDHLGNETEAQSLLRRAVQAGEANPAGLRDEREKALDQLAAFYLVRRRLDEAEPLFRRSLAIREQEEPGVLSLALLSNINNLALACHYHSGQKYEEAEILYRRAIAGFESLVGPESTEMYTSLNSLAELHRMRGKYQEAEPIFRRVLNWCERFPDRHPKLTALCSSNLALMLDVLGQHDEAERLFLQALEIDERICEKGHPEVIQGAKNLASHYHNLGIDKFQTSEFKKAEMFFRCALKVIESMSHPDLYETATTLLWLGTVAVKREENNKAENLYRRALSSFEVALGPERSEVADALHQLACLLRDQDQLNEAETLFFRALSIRETTLGTWHIETARTCNSFGCLRRKQGRIEEARDLFQRAWTIWNDLLGPDHPDTQMALRNLQDLP